MFSKCRIFCLLLLFFVAFLAFKNYEVWTYPIEFRTDMGTIKKSEKSIETSPNLKIQNDPNPIQLYTFIAEKNIFSPERKEFPIPAAMAEAKKSIVRPQIVLYGVTIAADYQSATVSNPGRPLRKEERETLTIKLGEKIGEYKLAKILPDRIAMENNGDTFELLLYDSKNPKKRMEARTETKPAMIASPQPAPVSPSAEAPRPTPSQESVEKPKEPVQEKVVVPPPPSRPVRPTFPPPETRRGRRMVYPPAEAPIQESVGN